MEKNTTELPKPRIGTTQELPKENCKEEVNWEPKVLVNMTNKNKKRLAYNLKIREALEIRRHNSGPGHGLNEDYGAYVKTTAWNPVFNQMGDS